MKYVIRRGMALIALAALMLTGCSSAGKQPNSNTIEVYLNMPSGSPQYEVMQKLVKKFEDEKGVKVKLSSDSANYENNMKVRMGSGNLPDVFSTHGWSVLRYSPFLEPLDKRSWAKYVDKGLNDAMRDKEGKLYSLPLEYTVTGLITNMDVLSKAGVNPDRIKTWQEFNDSLMKIKAAGFSPITSSGKDAFPAGDQANTIAAAAFTNGQLEEFKKGTFAKEDYQKKVLSWIEKWSKAGFYNVDYSSASFDDMARQIGGAKAGFAYAQPSLMSNALKFNPNANIGFIPFVSEDNKQYLIGGEGVNCFGVSKNSKKKEKALEFIDFLASPENAKEIVKALGTYSGLTNVKVDLGKIKSSYEKWVAPGKIPTKPFFDRVYLPNGMWSSLVSTTDGVISKQLTAEAATKQMADQFSTLYGQQKK